MQTYPRIHTYLHTYINGEEDALRYRRRAGKSLLLLPWHCGAHATSGWVLHQVFNGNPAVSGTTAAAAASYILHHNMN